jgi:hypothetical protein
MGEVIAWRGNARIVGEKSLSHPFRGTIRDTPETLEMHRRRKTAGKPAENQRCA